MNSFQNVIKWLQSDGRHFQIISQVSFLIYGIFFLNWDQNWLNYLAVFSGVLLAQSIAIYKLKLPWSALKSAFITGLGLSLLLRANHPGIFFFAGLISIGQKFFIRVNGKHLWNPANFGIILSIILSGNAWFSPGQWGSQAFFVLISSTGGFTVLSKVKRMETGLVFLVTTGILEWFRTVTYLGWNYEVWMHKMTNGALFLFAFFMITDPMTSPSRSSVRMIWAALVACVTFYLVNFHYMYSAVQWVLFVFTPLTPFIDRLFKAKKFEWHSKLPTVISPK
ncbi:MAG: RnfABCDGE type electron transport complex subunit D [Flavobacteriales bacterium]